MLATCLLHALGPWPVLGRVGVGEGGGGVHVP